MQRFCIECKKQYTNPGRRCNACRSKIWKKNNREKDLAQRRAYNKRRWEKVRPARLSKRCTLCTKIFKANIRTPQQLYCSSECRMRAYRSNNRDKVLAWRKKYIETHIDTKKEGDRRYKNKVRYGGNRYKVLERDEYLCTICFSELDLVIHHIDFSGQTDNPNNNMDNLQTLCRSCHIKEHTHKL